MKVLMLTLILCSVLFGCSSSNKTNKNRIPASDQVERFYELPDAIVSLDQISLELEERAREKVYVKKIRNTYHNWNPIILFVNSLQRNSKVIELIVGEGHNEREVTCMLYMFDHGIKLSECKPFKSFAATGRVIDYRDIEANLKE